MHRLQELKRRIRFEYVGLPKFRTRRKSQSLLARLPFELLEHIFAFACMDGGYTGCSLSRVSRSVRDASRVGRFTSVALHSRSPKQVSRFLSVFSQECDRAKAAGRSLPKVRHLYLEVVKCSDWNEQQAYRADVLSLIGLVAPDLWTLFLIQVREFLPSDIGRMSFPLLRELTIFGDGLSFTPLSPPPKTTSGGIPDDSDIRGLPTLPHLSRFHQMIAGVQRDGYPLLCCDLHQWAERAPGTTHLRLSNLPTSPPSGVITGTDDDETSPRFKHLQLLLLQPNAPPPSGGWCGTTRVRYSSFCSALGHMQAVATCRIGLGPFVPKKDLSEKKLERAARQEWQDRLGGGHGCWAVEQSWFTEAHIVQAVKKV